MKIQVGRHKYPSIDAFGWKQTPFEPADNAVLARVGRQILQGAQEEFQRSDVSPEQAQGTMRDMHDLARGLGGRMMMDRLHAPAGLLPMLHEISRCVTLYAAVAALPDPSASMASCVPTIPNTAGPLSRASLAARGSELVTHFEPLAHALTASEPSPQQQRVEALRQAVQQASDMTAGHDWKMKKHLGELDFLTQLGITPGMHCESQYDRSNSGAAREQQDLEWYLGQILEIAQHGTSHELLEFQHHRETVAGQWAIGHSVRSWEKSGQATLKTLGRQLVSEVQGKRFIESEGPEHRDLFSDDYPNEIEGRQVLLIDRAMQPIDQAELDRPLAHYSDQTGHTIVRGRVFEEPTAPGTMLYQLHHANGTVEHRNLNDRRHLWIEDTSPVSRTDFEAEARSGQYVQYRSEAFARAWHIGPGDSWPVATALSGVKAQVLEPDRSTHQYLTFEGIVRPRPSQADAFAIELTDGSLRNVDPSARGVQLWLEPGPDLKL